MVLLYVYAYIRMCVYARAWYVRRCISKITNKNMTTHSPFLSLPFFPTEPYQPPHPPVHDKGHLGTNHRSRNLSAFLRE